MYRVLILDDDLKVSKSLENMLHKHLKASEFVVQIHDINGHLPLPDDDVDIAVVDIDLGIDHPNGIEIVKTMFSDSRTQVIYVTDNIFFCTAVYETEHVSFLLKPLDQFDLNFALDKAIGNIEKHRRENLIVQVHGAIRVIKSSRIEFIESQLRKVVIHCDGEILSTYATMSDMEFKLPDYFLRCHKSYFVNMNLVSELSGASISLLSGKIIPVSQGKAKEVKRRFYSYLAHIGLR